MRRLTDGRFRPHVLWRDCPFVLIKTKNRSRPTSCAASKWSSSQKSSTGQLTVARQYRSCEDDKLWQLSLHFLNEVSTSLWKKAKGNSYIRKTIGIPALFDVFRIIALKTPREELEPRLEVVFRAASSVDFADQFFQASGKGRVQVKNAVLSAAGELREDDVSPEEYPFYQRLAPPSVE